MGNLANTPHHVLHKVGFVLRVEGFLSPPLYLLGQLWHAVNFPLHFAQIQILGVVTPLYLEICS